MLPALGLLTWLSAPAAQEAPIAPGSSVHAAQARELGAELLRPGEDASLPLELVGALPFAPPLGSPARHARPAIAPGLIVFGYLQSEVQVAGTRWGALTHVGSLFVGFDAAANLTGTGAFTGRSSALRAGGAAEAAGVKVILVVQSFDDSAGGVIATVMTTPLLRAKLAGNIAALVADDSYCGGVSLDLEFSWGASVRDGISAFLAELSAALDALDPALELSIYVNAIFNANQWDCDPVNGITPSVDYVLYSMYDWATGSTVHAISDFDNCLGPTGLHGYLNDGLPPEKLVPVVSVYSRRWNGTTVYNGTGSSPVSSGFTDALYDVTLNPNAGGPYLASYVRGDEAGWYAWTDTQGHARTWEGLEGLEVKLRNVLSLRDPGGTWSGRRLGGVGFWSLFWMAELTSFDPRSGASVSKTRTYPHVYQACLEILGPPGLARLPLDGFEGLDPRWRDPNEALDTVGDADGDSARALVQSPSGRGAPRRTTNALAFMVDLEGPGPNRAVLAHELLASPLAPTLTDLNATAGHFDATSALALSVLGAPSLAGCALRLLVIDATGELEATPAVPLAGASGTWRRLLFDLTAPGSVVPFTTAEPALASGDGVLATAGGGAADLSFYGFAVEVSGPVAGTLVLDELEVEDRLPAGLDWRINELRYADPALEFVELHGPAGPLPAGLVLRAYRASDGGVLAEWPLAGVVPDDGGGRGFLVAGDPGVPGVDLTNGFSATTDDLPDLDPGALELLLAPSGIVLDALVYEAFGGLDDLVRPSTLGVTERGPPWVGEVGPGTDAGGVPGSLGRWPDGRDTRVNGRDFSLQPASPGAQNGGSLALGARLSFETPPARAFQTYATFSVADPTLAGLPASTDGGRAYRCVDPAGGGVIGVLGDASLGAGSGCVVTGELYVPPSSDPPQAIAVGLGGRQGSTFFGPAPAANGYESGLWLIYENAPGVALADGRPDHPGVFELVVATHDNQDGAPVELLGSLSLAASGALEGTWVPFRLAIDPLRVIVEAQVNGVVLQRCSLPASVPRSGALEIGFRENHAGGPGPAEGTWVDGIVLSAP